MLATAFRFSFAYITLIVLLRDVWIRNQIAAVSRRASNLATHLPVQLPPELATTKVNPEIRHTLDPSFLSFPALSAGAYTTTLVVMEAVVSMMEAVVPSWKLSRLLTVAMSKQDFSARKLKCHFFIMVYRSLLTNVFTSFCLILNKICGRKSATWPWHTAASQRWYDRDGIPLLLEGKK